MYTAHIHGSNALPSDSAARCCTAITSIWECRKIANSVCQSEKWHFTKMLDIRFIFPFCALKWINFEREDASGRKRERGSFKHNIDGLLECISCERITKCVRQSREAGRRNNQTAHIPTPRQSVERGTIWLFPITHGSWVIWIYAVRQMPFDAFNFQQNPSVCMWMHTICICQFRPGEDFSALHAQRGEWVMQPMRLIFARHTAFLIIEMKFKYSTSDIFFALICVLQRVLTGNWCVGYTKLNWNRNWLRLKWSRARWHTPI